MQEMVRGSQTFTCPNEQSWNIYSAKIESNSFNVWVKSLLSDAGLET